MSHNPEASSALDLQLPAHLGFWEAHLAASPWAEQTSLPTVLTESLQ